MLAPERFSAWLNERDHTDKLGYSYNYHPRSDAHSKELAQLIWDDLYLRCPALKSDYDAKEIDYQINYSHQWPHTAKAKTIDLAVVRISGNTISEVIISCELKTVMTEHKKSQPRLFDELSSSHLIVHAGNPKAIALGLTVVNIADQFVSPLRQHENTPLYVSDHKQPYVADSMVHHLRGLAIRSDIDEAGFDAYCTFLVDCDNQGAANLWVDPPAPQPGDRDHYLTFLEDICQAYTERYSLTG